MLAASTVATSRLWVAAYLRSIGRLSAAASGVTVCKERLLRVCPGSAAKMVAGRDSSGRVGSGTPSASRGSNSPTRAVGFALSDSWGS